MATYAVETEDHSNETTFMPLHQDVATGEFGDEKFRISISVTNDSIWLNMGKRMESIALAPLFERWVCGQSITLDQILSPETRGKAKALLDLIDGSGNFDAHAGAERMAAVLLGDEWDKTDA